MDSNINIKFRTWAKGQPPTRIKLEVPGWGGNKQASNAQPWHCKPFIDGATYGLEIVYPFDTEVTVTSDGNGVCNFEMESNKEWDTYGMSTPFVSFAPFHFGFTSSLDIKTEEGYGILVLPHSRFFTDVKGEVPVPSIGLIESDWWPNIFFIAFKAPLLNQKYIFKKGEGIAQILVVPKKINYNICKMDSKEEQERIELENQLRKFGNRIYTRKWKDDKGNAFENKYKVLSNMESQEAGATKKCLNQLEEQLKGNHANLLTRRLVKQNENQIIQNSKNRTV